MRNANYTLDPSHAGKVGAWTRVIRAHAESGKPLRIHFTKRDGSDRIITGPVVEMRGQGSHSVVILDTEEGPRSANLYNILSVGGR